MAKAVIGRRASLMYSLCRIGEAERTFEASVLYGYEKDVVRSSCGPIS